MVRSDTPSKVLAAIKLIGAIAVAGALVAGLMLPYVGGVGVAARNGAQMVEDLPVEFSDEGPATMTRILAADDSLITNIYRDYRQPVPLKQVPLVMRQAIIAIEDSRFYEHHGVDTQGALRALMENVAAGDISQGGSTLTQQLVKNTLLYNATTEEEQQAAIQQDIGRKLREANIALQLEQQYTKEQILERYLNLMNFGAGAYGIAAASKVYFDLPPEKLNLAQATMLAGLVQNPTSYNPFNNPDAAKQRRDIVLDRMADQDYITDEQAAETKKQPIALQEGAKPPRNCDAATDYSGFFCAYVLDYVINTLGVSEDVLKQGGITIKTTMDPATQNGATNGIISQEPFAMGSPRAAVLDIVEPGTGKVRALAVNRKFGGDQSDPAQTNVNLTTEASAGSGSTYKVFTAAAALAQEKSIFYQLNAPDPYTSKISAARGDSPPYSVGNAGDYPAVLPLDKALYMSSNTYFMALQDDLGGPQPAVQMAKAMGLWAEGDPLPDQIVAEQRLSFTLGPEATSPLRLATAYATIASGGTRCEPIPIESILGPDGKPLINQETGKPYFNPGTTHCTPDAIPRGVATTLAQVLLKDVMPGFPGQTGARAYLGDGRQVAGKTGTTENNYSYAFVGFTPYTVGAVMAFNPTTQETMPAPSAGEEGFGGGYPALIWKAAMSTILANQEPTPFPPADPEVMNGNTFPLNVNCKGMDAAKCKEALTAAGLSPVQTSTPVESDVPKDKVALQDPQPGSRVTPGQTVYFTISKGGGEPPPACQPGQAPTPDKPCTPAPQPGGEQPPDGGEPPDEGGGGGNGNGGNGNGNGNGGGNGGD